MKRILALFLAVTAAFLPLFSCSEKASTKTSDTAAATTEEEARPYLDSLGDYNFGGEDFVVLCRKDTEYEAGVDELSGDIVEDEIYRRNLEVSERFNVKIQRYAIEGNCPSANRS